MRRIYLDNNATTAVRPEVLEGMLPFFTEAFGNPSSLHWAGRQASPAIEQARREVAALINAKEEEIVFTSCGSEGDNLALKGTVEALQSRGNHIITTAVEHPAVLDTCRFLEKKGVEVTYLPVDREGLLDLDRLERAITSRTILISVMWANNETGVLFPIREIGALARKHQVRFFTDAVQAAGRVPVDVEEAQVDLLSLSGHKIGAPKGVGILYIRKGNPLAPLIHGGHQERRRRAGTHNVAGIVGLGIACRKAAEELETVPTRVTVLRDRLQNGIVSLIPEIKVNGALGLRLPNTLNLCFAGIEGEALLLRLDMEGIAASSGSACTSGSLGMSHVLEAMQVNPLLGQSSVRFSLGRNTTSEDIDRVLEVLPPSVQKLRDMSPFWKAGSRCCAVCLSQ
ncbi:MAG: cysteine desulfurase NifS [Deltaproteobacteria bacterium]|nr:cysteine desulfurase NifS [Deltaproteobacteria bacterium]